MRYAQNLPAIYEVLQRTQRAMRAYEIVAEAKALGVELPTKSITPTTAVHRDLVFAAKRSDSGISKIGPGLYAANGPLKYYVPPPRKKQVRQLVTVQVSAKTWELLDCAAKAAGVPMATLTELILKKADLELPIASGEKLESGCP